MHQELQKYSLSEKGGYQDYKGLTIFAYPNLHNKAYEEFILLNPKKDSTILILWAWSWAFDQRLLDNGFINITSVDFIETSYKVKWTKFIKRDLNKDFEDLWAFDYIFAVEVVEHLENQFHFIRNIKKCLKTWWYCILSTPNIISKYSKANFIVKSELALFSELDLHETWHINIIAPHILNYNFKINWLTVQKTTNEGKFSLNLKDVFSFRSFIWYIIYNLMMPFLPWNKHQINIYILSNAN